MQEGCKCCFPQRGPSLCHSPAHSSSRASIALKTLIPNMSFRVLSRSGLWLVLHSQLTQSSRQVCAGPTSSWFITYLWSAYSVPGIEISKACHSLLEHEEGSRIWRPIELTGLLGPVMEAFRVTVRNVNFISLERGSSWNINTNFIEEIALEDLVFTIVKRLPFSICFKKWHANIK